MPHEWRDKIVVTLEELVPNWYTWPNLKSTLYRYRDMPTGPKRVQLGGNGRVMLIDFDTLPVHIQHGLGDPRQVKHVLEQYYKTDKDAVSFFTRYQLPNGEYLTAEHQERYITNASVLKALISLRSVIIRDRSRRGQNSTGITSVLCDHAKTFQKTLAVKGKAPHTLPESLKRFKEVLKAFEKHSYASLVSGKHGNENSRKVTAETLALLESMFATDTTKPTATEVHRRYGSFMAGNLEIIDNVTGEIFNPRDFKVLSKTSVTNYLSNWKSTIGTYALRSGDRQKYQQQFKPYHSLKKPEFAGSIISIDDRQPPFKTPDGKRPWFYNAIDLGSEAFTCWVYGNSKEGIILNFYRQLVRNYAEWGLCLPNELEAEMSLNSTYVDTFLREGVMFQNVRIEANNARGKRIEAYYRPLRYDIEKKREGWLARPFALSESNQTGSHEVKAQYYDDIIEGCLRDIETWNNMPHSIHKHLTRWDVFMQMQHPDLKPINYHAILPHVGFKIISSCKAGIIKLQGSEFLLGNDGNVCFGDELIMLLGRVEGKTIDLYWLDGNDGKVLKALIYINNQFQCEAVPKPRYHRAKIEQTAADLEAREIMSKYVSTIEAYGRRRKQSIERVTIIDNTPALKKSFVMPGLKQNILSDLLTGELLPEPPDELDFIPKQSITRSLKDRF